MRRKRRRLTLIHNAAAGDADHAPDALVGLLARAGYEVGYVSYKRDDLDAALARPVDLIAVAGGDGTVARVARRARPEGPPIAILPLGNANNIAKSLGLRAGLPPDVGTAWRDAETRPFYPIDAEGPWGRIRLTEGLGFGAVKAAMADLRDKTNRTDTRRRYAEAVLQTRAEVLKLQVGNELIEGGFPLLEVMTIPLLGPNLRLGHGADAGDREFVIAFLRDAADERAALADWIVGQDAGPAPPVSLRRATEATIAGRFRRIRIDGRVTSAKQHRDRKHRRPIRLTSAVRPLSFLAPAAERSETQR